MTTAQVPTYTPSEVRDQRITTYHWGRQDGQPRGFPTISEAEFRQALGDAGVGEFKRVYDQLVAQKLAVEWGSQ